MKGHGVEDDYGAYFCTHETKADDLLGTAFPLEDVKTGFLKESPSLTQCPYKGKARYYHAEVNGRWHEDIVWYYADPIHESSRIRGLVCFGQEFVDRIVVAGIEQPRPETSFSHGYR